MKKLLLLTTFLIYGQLCRGQYYKSAASLYVGDYPGISFKNFETEAKAYEIIASGRNDGIQVTGLYEFYVPAKISENLFMYYGGGFSLGFEEYRGVRNFVIEPSTNSNVTRPNGNPPKFFMMGLESIFGLEYRFKAPITAGINIKPRFSFIGMRYARLQFWDFALTVSFLI